MLDTTGARLDLRLKLDVVPLTESSWRVTDGRLPRSSASELVAYVERLPRGCSVLLLGAPGGPRSFDADSLDTALVTIRGRMNAASPALAS